MVDCLYGIRPQDYISTMEFWKPMAGFMTGNHFIHNIVFSRLPGSQLLNLYNWTERALAQCDENIIYIESGQYKVGDATNSDPEKKEMDLSTWRRLGYDLHSILANPQFLDPDHDDFRLAPTSPAFGLGFVTIDIAKIGIRHA